MTGKYLEFELQRDIANALPQNSRLTIIFFACSWLLDAGWREKSTKKAA
jgi:hypothetical protein